MSMHARFINICIVNLDSKLDSNLKSAELDLSLDWVNLSGSSNHNSGTLR